MRVTVASTGAENQFQADDNGHVGRPCEVSLAPPELVLVLHRGAVTVSSAGPRGLFKGMTTATSGVIARFPLLLPVRNSVASYGASAVTRTSDRGHVVVNEFSHLAAIFEPAVIKPSPQKSSSGFPRPWASKGQDGRMERLIAITMCTLCPVGAWAWVSSGGSTFALRTCWLQADVTASWRSASCPLRLQSVPLHRCAATPSESAVPDKQTKYERNLKERQLRGEEMTSTRDSVSASPLPPDDWRRFVAAFCTRLGTCTTM